MKPFQLKSYERKFYKYTSKNDKKKEKQNRSVKILFAKNFAQIDKLLSSFENIVIFHHIRPDGDCLGAQFGLKHLIEDNYENKKV